MPASSQKPELNYATHVSRIYDECLNVIQAFVIEYEVVTGKFPIGVLNEMRAILAHLARADQLNPCDPQAAERNLDKADRHIKRALLDCYKGLCVAYFNRFRAFKDGHREVSLHLVNNGDFLQRLSALEQEAQVAYTAARRADSDSVDYTEIQVFDSYEAAYLAYKRLDGFIAESTAGINFAVAATDEAKREISGLQSQLSESRTASAKAAKKATWLSWASILLGIISIVEALLIAGVVRIPLP